MQVGLLFAPLRTANAHVSPYVTLLIIIHKGVLSYFLISHFRRQTESPHNATAMFRCQALLIRQNATPGRARNSTERYLIFALRQAIITIPKYSSTASVQNHEGFVIFIVHTVGLVGNVKSAY
jgi:hypothetical protein